MGVVERRVCDVYGTGYDVRKVKVVYTEGEIDKQGVFIGHPSVETLCDRDMGPRARARLRRFIERATSPPKPKADEPSTQP